MSTLEEGKPCANENSTHETPLTSMQSVIGAVEEFTHLIARRRADILRVVRGNSSSRNFSTGEGKYHTFESIRNSNILGIQLDTT